MTPQSLAELETAVARNRGNLDARMRLGATYVQEGRNAEAVTLLEGVVAAPRHPQQAGYFLGVAYDAEGRFPDARKQYTAFLESGATGSLGRTVRGRLATLDRRELELAVQAALARESTTATTQPAPRVVGVFPFLNGAGESLAPLSRALAELLTIDLNQTGRLTVVERAQVQKLFDEIGLAENGAVDPQTAARAGRMLGAGRIVQGRLDGNSEALRVLAMVVPVPTGTQIPPIARNGALGELMSMQNDLALEVYRALGIELTVAERERVMRQPTQNVQALLAFGLGLAAEDGGRAAEAAAHYRRAAALDPNFAETNTALERTEAQAAVVNSTPTTLALEGIRVLPPAPTPTSASAFTATSRFAGVQTMVPGPAARDAVPEILGSEGFERRSLLNIIIRRPR